MPTSSRKVQTEITASPGKNFDDKNLPNQNYGAAATNRYEALSDDNDYDVEMEEVNSSDSINATPKQDNAKSISSVEDSAPYSFTHPLSRKSQHKLAQAQAAKKG